MVNGTFTCDSSFTLSWQTTPPPTPHDHLRKNCIQIVSGAVHTVGIFAVSVVSHCECKTHSAHAFGLQERNLNMRSGNHLEILYLDVRVDLCVFLYSFIKEHSSIKRGKEDVRSGFRWV